MTRITIEHEMRDIFGAADRFANESIYEIVVYHLAFCHVFVRGWVFGIAKQLTGRNPTKTMARTEQLSLDRLTGTWRAYK